MRGIFLLLAFLLCAGTPAWTGDKEEAEHYHQKCSEYVRQNKYDLAIEACTKAVELNPNDVVAYSIRGEARWLRGEYELAIRDYTSLIELGAGFDFAYNNRGVAYAALGQWERARLDLLKAVERAANVAGEPNSHYHLAFVLHKLGLEDEARRELEKAAELDHEILEARGQFLFKPAAETTLRFYADEYLFAARYLSAPEKYVARARKILGIRETPTGLAGLEVETTSGCVPAYPNRYLLAALVSSYDELPELSFVQNDKKLLLKLATCFLGVPKRNILVLEDPTLATFRRKSREFLSAISKRDAVVLFYYSGHGITDSRGQFYLLPKDAAVGSEADLVETALSLSELRKQLSLARGLKLAIIDACRVRVPWKPAVLMTEKVSQRDMAILFATAPGEMSVAERGGRASAFIAALYRMASRGIENLDFDGSGYVELSELIRPLVVQLRKLSPSCQRPELIGAKNIPVFPVE